MAPAPRRQGDAARTAFDGGAGGDHVFGMRPRAPRLSALLAALLTGAVGASFAGMPTPVRAETCFGPLAGQAAYPICPEGTAAPVTRAAEEAREPMPAADAATPTAARTDGTTGWTTPQGDGAYHVLPDGGTVTSRRSGGPNTFHTYNDGTMGWTTPQDGGAYHVLPDGRTVTSQGSGPTVFHNHRDGTVDRPGRPATALPPPGLFERPPVATRAR